MTAKIVLWKTKDGTQEWRVFSSMEKLMQFLPELLQKGVDPAHVMVASDSLHWAFPKFHSGCATVWNKDILNFANSRTDVSAAQCSEQTKSSDFKPYQTGLGWISPDGRFFPCEYGGHAAKAREIVGKMQQIEDASSYLEENGWAAVYKNPLPGKSLAIGTGKGCRRISDQQLKKLQTLGIMDKIQNLSSLL